MKNKFTYWFIKVFIVIITLNTLILPVIAHGGEDHSQPNKTETVTDKAETKSNNFISLEKKVETKTGDYKFILKIPEKIYQDDNLELNLKVFEVIPDSFIGEEAITNAVIKAELGKEVFYFKKGTEDNFILNTIIFSPDKNILNITLKINENTIKTSFEIKTIPLQTDYTSYQLDSIILLIIILSIYFMAKKKPSNSYEKLTFIFTSLIITTLSINLVHRKFPTKIKPNIEVKSTTNNQSNDFIVSKEAQLLFNITTESVSEKDLASGVNVSGIIKTAPENKAEIITPTLGKVILKTLSLGQKISKGEVLGEIEPIVSPSDNLSIQNNLIDLKLKIIELEAQLEPSKLKLKTTKQEYERSKEDLQTKKKQFEDQTKQAEEKVKHAQIDLAREKELYQIGSSSLKKVQDAEIDLKNTTLELESLKKQGSYTIGSESLKRVKEAELNFKVLQSDLEKAKKQLNTINGNKQNLLTQKKYPLISPIEGFISELNVSTGMSLENGKSIITIISNQEVILEAEVFEKDFEKVQSSSLAEFKVNAFPNKIFKIDGKENKLISIGNTINQEKRTIPFIYKIKNNSNLLKEGMFAEILIKNNSKKVKAIPEEALIEDLDSKYVFIYKGGENFEKRNIVIGNKSNNYIEVINGIEDGEKIAVNGIYELKSAFIGKK